MATIERLRNNGKLVTSVILATVFVGFDSIYVRLKNLPVNTTEFFKKIDLNRCDENIPFLFSSDSERHLIYISFI